MRASLRLSNKLYPITIYITAAPVSTVSKNSEVAYWRTVKNIDLVSVAKRIISKGLKLKKSG